MSFQFLGIPPKGELMYTKEQILRSERWFPISRDPPEGGTEVTIREALKMVTVSNF